VFRLIDTEQGLKDCNFTDSQITDNQLWLEQKRFYTVDLDKLLKEQITVSTIDIVNSSNYCFAAKSKFEWFKYASKTLNCDYQQNSF
jgi:hypothetical protein